MDVPKRKPDGSIIPHCLLVLLQIVVLVVPRFPKRRALCSVVLIGLFIISRIRPHFSNDSGLVQLFVLNWAVWLSCFEKILTGDSLGPESRFWRSDRVQGEAVAMTPFSLAKIKWALAMLLNMRGIRWNYQVKNTPPAKLMAKSSFLRQHIGQAFYLIFMGDVCSEIWRHFMLGSGYDPKVLTVRSPSVIHRFLWTWLGGLLPYLLIQLQYVIGAIIAVATNVSKAEDWPPYFGEISAVRTVRDFWGKYWHQTLRRPLTSLTDTSANALKIRRGTTLSSYFKLWLAFLLSGMLHAHAMLMVPSRINVTSSEKMAGVMQFFLLQAFVITLEDFIQWLWKKSTYELSPTTTQCLGYAWVIFSFWVTLPVVVDVLVHTRAGEDQFLPRSLAARWVRVIPLPPMV